MDSTALTEPSSAVGRSAVASGPAFQLLESKLHPPWSRPGLVDRVSLSDRLPASEAPVVVVVAPPGYGKTTLLAQWSAPMSTTSPWARSLATGIGASMREAKASREPGVDLPVG